MDPWSLFLLCRVTLALHLSIYSNKDGFQIITPTKDPAFVCIRLSSVPRSRYLVSKIYGHLQFGHIYYDVFIFRIKSFISRSTIKKFESTFLSDYCYLGCCISSGEWFCCCWMCAFNWRESIFKQLLWMCQPASGQSKWWKWIMEQNIKIFVKNSMSKRCMVTYSVNFLADRNDHRSTSSAQNFKLKLKLKLELKLWLWILSFAQRTTLRSQRDDNCQRLDATSMLQSLRQLKFSRSLLPIHQAYHVHFETSSTTICRLVVLKRHLWLDFRVMPKLDSLQL